MYMPAYRRGVPSVHDFHTHGSLKDTDLHVQTAIRGPGQMHINMGLRGNELVTGVPFLIADADKVVITRVRTVDALQGEADLIFAGIACVGFLQRQHHLIKLRLIGVVSKEVAVVITIGGAGRVGHNATINQSGQGNIRQPV